MIPHKFSTCEYSSYHVHKLEVTHDIYKPFDDRLEIKGVFVDIPKDFDKGWYEELL